VHGNVYLFSIYIKDLMYSTCTERKWKSWRGWKREKKRQRARRKGERQSWLENVAPSTSSSSSFYKSDSFFFVLKPAPAGTRFRSLLLHVSNSSLVQIDIMESAEGDIVLLNDESAASA
jgi:hypothetical protein